MIFVTGGSGFIGKHVVKRLLQAGERILVLVRDASKYQPQGNEEILEGNLASVDEWRRDAESYPLDACIHLAWEGIPDYSYEQSKINLEYGLGIVEFCKHLQIRNLVMTGSCWEYDNPHGKVSNASPINERNPNSFQAAKTSLRIMAQALCKEAGIDFHWLRLFYVYGPGQRSGSLIPSIIQSFQEGRQPELRSAYARNDFVYVEDVADAIIQATKKRNASGTLNVGSGKSELVLSIAEHVAECFGIEFDRSPYTEENGSEIDFYADAEETHANIGWCPETPIKDGIRKMLDQT